MQDNGHQIKDKRVLIIGSGGIGCELLKNLAQLNISHIEIVDLDTIDISNLNRQFLFQKEHVLAPKALVAKENILKYRPHLNIISYYANIKDPQFSFEFFKRFDIVMNALDNLDARRHVNFMCVASGVPLIETGTAGYLGQVCVIIRGRSECFDCQPKQPPITYPICTIRNTPSALIHCVVWAKDYLFNNLFGSDSLLEISTESTQQQKETPSKEESEALNMESTEFVALKALVHEQDFCIRVIKKVFESDVQRLINLGELWKTRSPPSCLCIPDDTLAKLNTPQEESILFDDLKILSLEENILILISSMKSLIHRAYQRDDTFQEQFFDKDDKDTLDFVFSAANIRATLFHIGNESRFKIKEMAGNIIPAIATTNAIIAGLATMEAIKIMNQQWDELKNVFYGPSGNKESLFSVEKVNPPNPQCSVCQIWIAEMEVNTEKTTLEEFIRYQYPDIEISVSEGARVLYDPDFTIHLKSTFSQFGLTDGKFFQVIPEDDDQLPFLYIIKDKSNSSKSSNVSDSISIRILYKVKQSSKKRKLETEDDKAESDHATVNPCKVSLKETFENGNFITEIQD